MDARVVDDNARIQALVVINEEKSGYVAELIRKVGQTIVDEFISIGFIICGFTPTAKTWRLSKLGEDYYCEIS